MRPTSLPVPPQPAARPTIQLPAIQISPPKNDGPQNGLQKTADFFQQLGDLKEQKDVLTGRSQGTTFAGDRNGIVITVKKVDIANRKSNGVGWDFLGGKPDPRVYIKRKKFLSGQGHTKTQQDSFTFACSEKIFGAGKDDTLIVEVFDMDEGVNDFIGSAQFELDPETIRRGRLSLSFGQVDELILQITD